MGPHVERLKMPELRLKHPRRDTTRRQAAGAASLYVENGPGTLAGQNSPATT